MKITLIYASAPRTVHELGIDVPERCNVGQALERAGWLACFPEVASCATGVWNHRCGHETTLHEGDRVEVYRPLRVDPKVARRERFVGQGARGAGLFAKRRAGSKSGY